MATNKVIFGNQILIDLTLDDVDETKVVAGTIFHKPNGESSIGDIPVENDFKEFYPLSAQYPILYPSAYYKQGFSVGIDQNTKEKLQPYNIKSGINILGIVGTLESPNTGVFFADTGTENSIFDIDTGLEMVKTFIAYFSNENIASGTARQRAYIQWDSSSPDIYDGSRSLISTNNAQSCAVIHHPLGTRIANSPSINDVSGGKITIQMPANIGYIKGTWHYIAVGD